jgi:hypothetical protein
LARLPDVTAEAELQRTAPKSPSGNIGYRFDPPQASRQSSNVSGESPARSATLRSELVYVPRGRRMHQPHVFGRERASLRQPRRESPILPRSNPFENPRRPLLDSIAPMLRFITLVVLFTAVGIWIQMIGRANDTSPVKELQPPTTTVDERVPPAAKTAERPAGATTSSGPVGTTPEMNMRLGRVREGHGYAKLRGDILSVPKAGTELEMITSNTGDPAASLPRVQTAELPNAAIGAGSPLQVSSSPAHSINARLNAAEESAIREAQRFDGFRDKTPWR